MFLSFLHDIGITRLFSTAAVGILVSWAETPTGDSGGSSIIDFKNSILLPVGRVQQGLEDLNS